MNPLIVIPSRLEASRFPNKPLADVAGMPMIIRVLKNAQQAQIGPVVVATPNKEIIDLVEQHKGIAVQTAFSHATGSDRIYEAVQTFDPNERYNIIINLQGDLPTITPSDLRNVLIPLKENLGTSISTIATPLESTEDLENKNIVKISMSSPVNNVSSAFYFSRAPIPYGAGAHYHHAGIYAYRRTALSAFVQAPPTHLEKQESLEQLRALEMGLKIGVYVTNSFLPGVDTPQDLELVTNYLKRG